MTIIRDDYDCQNCSEPSGYSIVCDSCRPKLTKSQTQRLMSIWHGLIREEGRHGEWYQCFHCEEPKAEDEVCGDHFWFTKGRRPDLKFDVRVGVPCCKPCNTSGNKNRKNPKEMECPFSFPDE